MSLVEQALKKAQSRRSAERGSQVAETRGTAHPVEHTPPEAPQSRHAPAKRLLELDLEKLRGHGLLPPLDAERRILGDFRRIKRPLVARATEATGVERHEKRRAIFVGGALPGEGKTFTAVNLALSLALEKDVGVLLIDADVAKPQISTLIGMQGAAGLLDVLRSPDAVAEPLVCTTNVPGLEVLAAGTRSDVDTELLASRRMQVLMSELLEADPQRLIVLDSPPLLVTNESSELAKAAGQVVMVVRDGHTPQRAVLEALAMLPKDAHVGLVFNDSRAGTAGEGYYGYGAYGAVPTQS